jgi:hypothetical protein
LLVAVLATLVRPVSAAQRLPVTEPTDEFEVTWKPPHNGFEWRLDSRFGSRVNGIVDYHWDEATTTYDPGHVRPTSLQVHFWGCPTEEEDGRDGATALDYRWEVRDGNDESVVVDHTFGPRCSWTRDFAIDLVTGEAAPTLVRVTITERDTGRPWSGYPPGQTFSHQPVAPKDLLIVSLGDSYGAGEGNPDVPRSSTTSGSSPLPPAGSTSAATGRRRRHRPRPHSPWSALTPTAP